ncbi:uncharacterized protein IL334_002488 [Kwoniella shivajii]|uniref:Uncharacterized protein n=1 Tax=Kwoniella shivajii TaxID=564305 RepID=A0ABZ1CUV6_9TREE|nr:hypothetical protein IL334_002488 [Kwoniella shivajii]
MSMVISSASTPSSHTSPIPKTPQPLQDISLPEPNLGPNTNSESGPSSQRMYPKITHRRDPDIIIDENMDMNMDMDMNMSRDITPSSPSDLAVDYASPSMSLGSMEGSHSISTGSTSGLGEDDHVHSHGHDHDHDGHGHGHSHGQIDMDKFLKKMEMEKKMQALQQRLELASMKATNGWKDMSIKEIETKLPPTPLRSRKSQLLPSSPITKSPTRSSPLPYEPPSPSRPWQLIDVLWQPLPPPTHGRYPTSPSSPKKRSRTDDTDLSLSRTSLTGLGLPLSPNRQRKSPMSNHIHRRASSSITAQERDRINGNLNLGNGSGAGPSSPLRYGLENAVNNSNSSSSKKKRSQSHSTHMINRRKDNSSSLTTSQDVDAAKALTYMLQSSSSSGISDDDLPLPLQSNSRRNSNVIMNGLSAPAMTKNDRLTNSLPIPEAFARNGSTSPSLRPGALQLPLSINTTPRSKDSNTRNRLPDSGSTTTSVDQRGEEDKNAAELMMFLAHSPSPMKRFSGQNAPEPESPTNFRPSLGAAARVLFADDDSRPAASTSRFPSQPDIGQSNLALAPPITP